MVSDHAQEKAAGLDKWGKKVTKIQMATPNPNPTPTPNLNPNQVTKIQMARTSGNAHDAQRKATKMAAKAAELKRVC